MEAQCSRLSFGVPELSCCFGVHLLDREAKQQLLGFAESCRRKLALSKPYPLLGCQDTPLDAPQRAALNALHVDTNGASGKSDAAFAHQQRRCIKSECLRTAHERDRDYDYDRGDCHT